MRLPGQSKVQRTTPYEVIESDGVVGGRYPVEAVKAFNEGLVFIYKKGLTVERVYAPRDYIPLKMDGVFWIGKELGNNSAARLVTITDELAQEVQVHPAVTVVGEPTDPDCPGQDLSRLVASDILHIGWRATRKPSNTWIFIAIAVVVIIAVIAYAMRG